MLGSRAVVRDTSVWGCSYGRCERRTDGDEDVDGEWDEVRGCKHVRGRRRWKQTGTGVCWEVEKSGSNLYFCSVQTGGRGSVERRQSAVLKSGVWTLAPRIGRPGASSSVYIYLVFVRCLYVFVSYIHAAGLLLQTYFIICMYSSAMN